MPRAALRPIRRCVVLGTVLAAAIAAPAQAQSGQSAYVANGGVGGVFQYVLGPAGGLAALAPPSIATSGPAGR